MPYGGIEIRKNKAVPLVICIVRHKVVQNETDLNSPKTISVVDDFGYSMPGQRQKS